MIRSQVNLLEIIVHNLKIEENFSEVHLHKKNLTEHSKLNFWNTNPKNTILQFCDDSDFNHSKIWNEGCHTRKIFLLYYRLRIQLRMYKKNNGF